MARKGKGLTPQELAIFTENESFWQGNYLSYVKSLTSDSDLELAQIRRRFQSSFRTIGENQYEFTYIFTTPEEIPQQIPSVLHMEIEVGVEFPRAVRRVSIQGEGMDPRIKEVLERGVMMKCMEVGSFWRVVKLMDVHVVEIYQLGLPQPQVSDEVEEEGKTDETAEEKAEENKAEVGLIPSTQLEEIQTPTELTPVPVKSRLNRAPILRYRASTQFVMLRNVGSAACLRVIIAVNCTRCKQLEEITLEPEENNVFSGESECGNCHQQLNIDFQANILHEQNTTNLGDVKTQNCTPFRVLYFTYKAACFSCSTDIPVGPFSILEKVSSNCPQCAEKFAFSIGQVEFLSEEPAEKSVYKRSSRPRAQLTIGEPLPDKGTCKHYRQSYRWFRFRCCQNVYPCDKCHEEQSEEHEYDKAEFMICGYCSTEQKIGSIVTCVRCKQPLTQEGSGDKRFWEGGKGCRTQTQMSRNERRKYRK